jgi:glycosyltransferase involved in cell wall biosynthesis
MKLLERCAGLPIHFHFDISELEKQRLLARATLYWHATGMGRKEPVDAYAFEHFGISVVEAMGAGCIPLCYAGGGPTEIIEFGRSGWLFDSPSELAVLTQLTAWSPERMSSMQREARARAQVVSQKAFSRNLHQFLAEVAP